MKKPGMTSLEDAGPDVPATPGKNKGGPAEVSFGRALKSAITYFPAEQYHRQAELHFCVRDGNRCFLNLMVTDKRTNGLSSSRTIVHDVAFRDREIQGAIQDRSQVLARSFQPSSFQGDPKVAPGMGAW